MNKAYTEAVDWLFEQFPAYQNKGANAYKPGLERIEELCAHFDFPQENLKCIHAAGSNGKGSTCSMIAAGLTQSGYKTGLFTSPHIVDFSERIRINGQCIEEAFVIEFVQHFKEKTNLRGYSFFEITFAMALCYFKEQKCDYCVIETGLGGRLDATNIITPIISVITNISIEHTQFLGSTIEEIAAEKAGIIKENTPVIISEYTPATKTVFEDKATSVNAPIYWSESCAYKPRFDFPLKGDYQHLNYNTALMVLKYVLGDTFIEETIQDGIANIYDLTGFYGRLYTHPNYANVLFDVSHNEDGIQKTLSYIQTNYNPENCFILYGTSSDKDLSKILPLFTPFPNLTFTEFNNERSAKFENYMEFMDEIGEKFTFFDDAKTALHTLQNAINEEDTIIVIGSFFLISNIFEKK